jgi:hypothetical protein
MADTSNEPVESDWQTEFLHLLPEIQQRLRSAFRSLKGAAREEANAEAVLHAVIAYVRLHEQRRQSVATASTLAYYAAKRTNVGRPAVGSASCKDVLSRLGQVSHNLKVHNSDGGWVDALTDTKCAPIPDIVATRIDFRDWFKTLSRGMKKIATDLALGHATMQLAEKYELSPGRVSQCRRALYESWSHFQNEANAARS